MAQLRLACKSHGALPPLHCPQLVWLICQNPTSYVPLVLYNMACEFPPLSWETIHLQQAWFHPYFPHHPAISPIFLAVPQGQLGHLPLGQFPPHESAKATERMTIMKITSFISSVLKNILFEEINHFLRYVLFFFE